jgi:hypothetical protein
VREAAEEAPCELGKVVLCTPGPGAGDDRLINVRELRVLGLEPLEPLRVMAVIQMGFATEAAERIIVS